MKSEALTFGALDDFVDGLTVKGTQPMTNSESVEVTQADIECWKAIFGFDDQSVDIDGDDKHGLELLAKHRLAAAEQSQRVDEDVVEQAARAIYVSAVGLDDDPEQRMWAECSESTRSNFRRHARAAIAAMRRAEDEWQPIETAPKDGSQILLGGCKSGPPVRIGHWGSGRYLGPKQGYERDCAEGSSYGFDPTHWRPLSAPPAHLQQKDEADGE